MQAYSVHSEFQICRSDLAKDLRPFGQRRGSSDCRKNPQRPCTIWTFASGIVGRTRLCFRCMKTAPSHVSATCCSAAYTLPPTQPGGSREWNATTMRDADGSSRENSRFHANVQRHDAAHVWMQELLIGTISRLRAI